MVKIEFEITEEYGVFRDCIVLPDDHNMSDVEIEAIKQKRYDDWMLAISAVNEEPVEGEE
jgi:hypothetical protein